jgi:death-on-curing family protein
MLFDINNETFRNYLINKLVRIIKTQHEFIKNIPDINGISGGDYHLRTKHDEQALIINVINHMLYNKNECNILSLVARIVFAINANHLYNNGNKRTSIAALSAILRWFGYYLYFSSDMDKLLDY